MPIESIPSFTPSATKFWAKIPSEARNLIIANTWCGTCRDVVTMVNISGKVERGDLILAGQCESCKEVVARLVEK